MRFRPLAALLLLAAASSASLAASFSTYNSAALWQAATSGPVLSEDFSGYADGTDLNGLAFLPSVSVTSNLPTIEVFGASNSLFGFGGGARAAGNAFYEINYGQAYRAAAFNLAAFESIPGDGSTAVDEGLIEVLFGDGTTQQFNIAGGDGSPIFFGLIADVGIERITWFEAHEASGGNEETGLDNFMVANAVATVPLPGSLALSLLALPLLRRRPR